MRIVHALGWYFPDSTGGTEAYVDTLATVLREEGVTSAVIAGRDRGSNDHYSHHGVDVFRYPVPATNEVAELRGDRPHRKFEEFQRLLEAQHADVYHQHTWSRGCGIHHLRFAKSLGLKTVLTVHVASNICLRGDMMLFGKDPCDGLIEEGRCSRCWAVARGIPKPAAWCLARVPLLLATFMARPGPAQKLRTSLATRYLVREHLYRFGEAWRLADRVVAVAGWVHEALKINGIPEERLILCPHGVQVQSRAARRELPTKRGLRVGFLGRADPIKGLHLLIEALLAIPREVPITLQVYAIANNTDAIRYLERAKTLASSDARITFEAPFSLEKFPDVFEQIDVLAVPSQCLETGPLVALEALSAGIPVIGSDLGGTREKIENGVNGLLVSHTDVAGWSKALRSLVDEPHLLKSLRDSIEQPRSSRSVGEEMKRLYHTITGRTGCIAEVTS